MPHKLTEQQFIDTWHRTGGALGVSQASGLNISMVYKRRRNLEKRGIHLPTIPQPGYEQRVPAHYRAEDAWTFPRQRDLWLDTGSAVIFSDAHYWPGEPSVAHRALLKVIRKIRPRVIFANGDVFDGVSICRHPPFGWSTRPSVLHEMEACIERLGDIEQAAPKGCELLWNIGNHDIRFERTLAMNAKEFAGLHGMRLADHFPAWEMQWSTLINGSAAHPVMVKHKHVGGIHAGYNNTLKGGYTIVTGHTHILEAKPWNDYRGRRYGIQSGTLADVDSPAFEYQENSPSPACSGFVVLTFKDGKMLPPELCEVVDGEAWFRGEVYS